MTTKAFAGVASPLPVRKTKIRESRYWAQLWHYYWGAPSIALCRVPELEYASTLNTEVRFLDHCCGDGKFAELAWPGKKITAGCDIDDVSLEIAKQRGLYDRLDRCDAGESLPYENESFDVVFDNSAIEHIKDLDRNLQEISRVLVSGGVFAFNVLNHRYFEWWPLSTGDKTGYRDWQPFHHALSLEEWNDRLSKAGLSIASIQGYFDRPTARLLAGLDCEFSGKFLANRSSLFYDLYFRFPRIAQRYVAWRTSQSYWMTEPDAGAGYFIQATKP